VDELTRLLVAGRDGFRAEPSARTPLLTTVRVTAATIAVLVVAMVIVVATARPAAAHGVGGLQPTNYKTRVDGIAPPAPGIHVRTVDAGTKIELRNDSGHDVIVVGYQREPYLRIGPDGTYENERSPAVFLNRTSIPRRAAPRGQYDAKADPSWRRISQSHTASWHDHRTHWMDSADPPVVRNDPSHVQVVIRGWTIPLIEQGRRLTVTGDVLWVPGPSPWPWIIGAIALAVLVVVLCRSSAWVVVMEAALGVVIVSETVHVIGSWQAATASLGSRALASVYSIGGIAVCVLAFVWLRRRDPWAATPAVLIAGLFVLVAGGLADLTTLTRSQLPTTLPDAAGRLTVTLALGLGAGLVIAAAGRLRPPVPKRPSAHHDPVPTPIP
jgi:hypothetical protein